MFANKKCVCILLPCFLITLFSFSHLWAQEGSKKTVSAKNQAQISVESPHYDAGEIWEGKKEIVHTFTIKNTGTAPLTIKKVEAG